MAWFRPLLVMVSTLSLTVGCAKEDPSPCVEFVQPSDCLPEYEPTFQNIYERTILQRCAIGGGSCHLASGARGGLVLEGLETAHEALVAQGLVVAADPECSVLIDRLERVGQPGLMPPGSPLTEAERCAVTQWVRAGANR